MKKTISLILAAVMLAAMFTACSTGGSKSTGDSADRSENNDMIHTLYYKDKEKRETVIANFFNSDSGKSEEVVMNMISEDNDGFTYSCEADASAYNMAYINYDKINTPNFAFNRCVSGWYNSDHGFLPYTEGKKINFEHMDDFEEITLKCNGYDKGVCIWTPDDYDPDSKEKYSTIYLLDGQAMVYLGLPGETLTDSEHADVQVQSMTEVTGHKAIVVAVYTFGDENKYTRIDELVPDIGELAYDEDTKKCGNEFSDFLTDTLMPYINENYNVYTDALHTSIAGKSLGGIEAFYIAMENPDKFGTAGLLSPSFWLYNDEVWRDYLSKMSFDENSPFLYFYTGNEEEDTGAETKEMVGRLKDMSYPSDKYVLHYNENGGHVVAYWRSIFAEFLDAMVFQNIPALQDHKSD